MGVPPCWEGHTQRKDLRSVGRSLQRGIGHYSGAVAAYNTSSRGAQVHSERLSPTRRVIGWAAGSALLHAPASRSGAAPADW